MLKLFYQWPHTRIVRDWPAWHFNPKGVFTVKSAYKLAISRREQEKARDGSGSNDTDLCEESFDWKKIWNLRLPNTRRGVKCETILHNALQIGWRLWASLFQMPGCERGVAYAVGNMP